MNKTQQRIKIAEALGWKRCSEADYRLWGNDPENGVRCEVPFYANDLNAIHEAEQTLKGKDWIQYFGDTQTPSMLIKVCKRWDVALGATAAQRAEAFLRTLGLWEDE